MIKLQRGVRPTYLSDQKVQELTDIFKADKNKTVWKQESIGESLLTSSSFKCAYCECKLQIEDSYMQVEHFKDKDTYPDDVVDWENLLPSCGRCNRKKWTLDVITNPIVNPYIDEPKVHLCQESFRLYGKDEKGKTTVKKLFLNDDDRVVLPRFLVCNELNRQLSIAASSFTDIDDTRDSMSTILSSCQSDKPYSAFLATTLHTNQDYLYIKKHLEDCQMWDHDLEALHQLSLKLVLDQR